MVLHNRHLVVALIAVFLVSGFSGLIYQSIWTHYLKLFLGHAAYAQALVLATFMGGLALGSWWAAQLSRGKLPLLYLYALAEIAVGVYALLFHRLFIWTVELTFDSLLPGLDGVGLVYLVKWGVGLLLILPPSILLGTTFPLMAAGLLQRSPGQGGRLLALLYFSNSFGAALGVLVSGFVLIAALGLPGTVALAGVLNILVALLVLLLVGRAGEAPLPQSPEPETTATIAGGRPVQRLLLIAAVLTGFASFVYELSWIRMLNLVLGAATHSFELMLASFILGLALGGWWIRNRIDQFANPLKALAWIQLLMGSLAAATLVFYNQLFDVMVYLMAALDATEQGYALFKLSSMGLAMAVMLPASICAGMTLPLITATLTRVGYDSRAVGHVYAVNTVGAIVGVALTAAWLIPLLGLRNTLLLGAFVDVVTAVMLMRSPASKTSPRWPLGFAVAGLLILALVYQAPGFDHRRMSSSVYRYGMLLGPDAQVAYYRDGRSATVSVVKGSQGDISIFTNGKSDAAIAPLSEPANGDEHTMLMLGHLGMALHPQPRQVAVIGFGSGLSTHALLGNPELVQVDTIEIESAMIEGARLFGERVARAYQDPRSQLHIDDAKTFFSTRQKRYDLIVSEPSNPWVSGVAGLFSREHYRQVKRYLLPGGLYLQWLPLYETNMGLVSSVLKAFSAEFTDFALYTGADNDLLIIGRADGPLGSLSDASLAHPLVAADMTRIQVEGLGDLVVRYLGDKATLESFLAQVPVPANSDYYPYLDAHAERARFVGSNASDIMRLNRLWLMGDSWLQSQVWNTHTAGLHSHLAANFLRALFLAELLSADLDLRQLPSGQLPEADYRRARNVASMRDRCDVRQLDGDLEDALWLSDATAVYGPSALISEFWGSIVEAPCFDTLAPQVRLAYQFFYAVSARENQRILELAAQLLPALGSLRGYTDYVMLQVLSATERMDRPQLGLDFLEQQAPMKIEALEVLVLVASLRAQVDQR